jgi:hypothetical protein
MFTEEYTTERHSIMALPLVRLADPEFLIPVLSYTVTAAPPCVAEALMGHLIHEEMRRTGKDRVAACSYLESLIH